MAEKLIFIDPRKCIGCRACEVACAIEHGGKSFIKVYLIEQFHIAVPLNCRHCEKAPCMAVCPVNAIKRDYDGAIVIDYVRCIGCKLCMVVCPFGIPEIDDELKVMIKCDLCADRRAKGLPPACVETCPADALIYGPIEEYTETKRRKAVLKVASEIKEGQIEDMTRTYLGKRE